MPQSWVVVGGADKGGILVRHGKGRSSPEAASRLSCGARVQQLSLDGERLHYKLLSGEGPGEGWVSLSVKGKPLLEHAVEEPAPVGESTSMGAFAANVFARFQAGELDETIQEYRAVLRQMPLGPSVADKEGPRSEGYGTPWSKWTAFAEGDSKPRLLFTGDSITHAVPWSPSSPWAAAIAYRNRGLDVRNAGWGGIMSMSLLRPQDFNVPMPPPSELEAEQVCILIGTNDAIAISSSEAAVDAFYVPEQGGVCRLPKDWRTRCKPSVELYEESLAAIVDAYVGRGSRVAIATPPLLGEALPDQLKQSTMRSTSFATCMELSRAVHRVAAARGCDVLPLFECIVHRLRQLRKRPVEFTMMNFGRRMNQAVMLHQQQEKTGNATPFEDLELGERTEFLFDLVHLNETGAALHSALVQEWLNAGPQENT